MALIVIIFLQGCSVYHKQNVTLEEASKANTKVLMVRENDKKVHLYRVELVDGLYYGVRKVSGGKAKILLDEKDIKSLRLLNSSASTFGTIGIVIGSIIIVTLIAGAISLSGGVI